MRKCWILLIILLQRGVVRTAVGLFRTRTRYIGMLSVVVVLTVLLVCSVCMLPTTLVLVVMVVCTIVGPDALMSTGIVACVVSVVTIGMMCVSLLVLLIGVVLGCADLLLTLSVRVFLVIRVSLRVIVVLIELSCLLLEKELGAMPMTLMTCGRLRISWCLL